jgi:hypothetical protein
MSEISEGKLIKPIRFDLEDKENEAEIPAENLQPMDICCIDNTDPILLRIYSSTPNILVLILNGENAGKQATIPLETNVKYLGRLTW